ncbi:MULTISPECIES: cold-shock protein [Pandoraea]|uniref:Cold shock-like protein CspA n=1 Tax=Pandoraea cepalis TaxID=2508294 RepID=A0A5E4Y940_9BURK|nr:MULTISPECIES: cold-shock protein [Pandoraea]QBC31860.1 cold-shock protein [Pandoraea sp. XY-2]VVE44805.1 Cold shock-like protein CspA [Pandoraea cepalis]
MSSGIVKWFNDSRGFGFITPDDGGADLFAHFFKISADNREEFRTPQENQRVSFNVVQSPKGPQASNIKPA